MGVSQTIYAAAKKLALLEPHVGQDREWLSFHLPPAMKSLNDNINWDSNLMVSMQISSTTCVQDGKVLDHPAKSQPEYEVTKFPVSSNIQASTAYSAYCDKDFGGELPQTTSSTVLPTTIYASLDGDLTLTRRSEETQRAMETIQKKLQYFENLDA